MKFQQWLSQFFFHFVRLLITLLILSALLGLAYWRMNHLYQSGSLAKEEPAPISGPLAKDVKSGEQIQLDLGEDADIQKVAQALLDQGLIQDKASFIQIAADQGLYAYFSGGSYDIPKDAKVQDLLNILTEPKLEALKDTEVVLPAGASVQQVADILFQQQLITSKYSFVKEAQNMGMADKFQAGKHIVNPPIKVADLIQDLCKQEEVQP